MFFHELDTFGFSSSPQRGDKVSFEIGQYKGRAKAFNVTPDGGSNELR
jgi:cold shock CspA family protein